MILKFSDPLSVLGCAFTASEFNASEYLHEHTQLI